MTVESITLPETFSDIPLIPLDQPANTVFVMTLRDYNLFQITLILGDDHKWLAGIDLHHDPQNELFKHWIDSGAAQRFREHYKVAVGPDNFGRNFGPPMHSA